MIDVKVPNVGESVSEGMIQSWRVKDGDIVARDQVLLDLETDKATVEVFCEAAGAIKLLKKAGETVAVGAVIAQIDTDKAGQAQAAKPAAEAKAEAKAESKNESAPANNVTDIAASSGPAAKRFAEENKIDLAAVRGSAKDGRVTKEDLINHMEGKGASKQVAAAPQLVTVKQQVAQGSSGSRTVRREPMSMMRRRIAERLVQAQSTAAILTTFNEIDMSGYMELRNRHKDAFKEKYGASLGFMGIFVKASIEALKSFPAINGWIEGNEIVYHDYYDIGVAVSSDKGLVVPVVRDADRMTLAELEGAIAHYAKKARDGKIAIDDLTGGTFTVSNGGVFGSMMSTPILNPPQSGILGMHKTTERAVVIDGQIVIRPMMYVALSYDHRIVDGREAVQFLVRIKECIENPARLVLGI